MDHQEVVDPYPVTGMTMEWDKAPRPFLKVATVMVRREVTTGMVEVGISIHTAVTGVGE